MIFYLLMGYSDSGRIQLSEVAFNSGWGPIKKPTRNWLDKMSINLAQNFNHLKVID